MRPRALAASEQLSASVRFRAVTGRPSRPLHGWDVPIVLQKSPWRSCRIKIRNNRIGANGFLNQRCALTPDLESILRTQTGKILLQQNRHKAADVIENNSGSLLELKRT